MATFKVKTFNELSGKGQNGDIAIIERADINGNQGFTFRDASGWSLPFVQVQTLGANLMTTNTSQSVSAPKTFQGEVVINDDFSVIGATDIDLGFTGEFDITGNDEVGSQFTVSLTETITLTSSDGGTTLGSASGTDFSSIEIEPTSVDITTDNLNANVGGGNIEINDVEKLSLSDVNQIRINDPSLITFEGDDEGDSKARIWVNKYPTDHLGAATNSDGAFGLYFRKAWYIPAQFDYVGLLVNGGYIKLISTKSGTPFREALSFDGQVLEFVTKDSGYTRKLSFSEGTGAKILVSDSGATKFGIEYAADYSAGLKANPRSIIDAGTMTVMLEDYIAAVPTYADNAAAVLGGLAVGKMYKTSAGELRIVV